MTQVAALLKRNASLLALTNADWLADVFADSQRSVPGVSRFVTPAWTLRMTLKPSSPGSGMFFSNA